MGRRKGDWVCKKCRRANVDWRKYCQKCFTIRDEKIKTNNDFNGSMSLSNISGGIIKSLKTIKETEEITKQLINNWEKRNGFLGVKRFRLESFSEAKRWKVKRTIAIMRKKGLIVLQKRYYFVIDKRIKIGDKNK